MTLDELKNKYQPALQAMQDDGVVLSHVLWRAESFLFRVSRRRRM